MMNISTLRFSPVHSVDGNLTISNSLLKFCISRLGGAVYVSGNTQFIIENTTMESNKAEEGGALTASGDSHGFIGSDRKSVV